YLSDSRSILRKARSTRSISGDRFAGAALVVVQNAEEVACKFVVIIGNRPCSHFSQLRLRGSVRADPWVRGNRGLRTEVRSSRITLIRLSSIILFAPAL